LIPVFLNKNSELKDLWFWLFQKLKKTYGFHERTSKKYGSSFIDFLKNKINVVIYQDWFSDF